MSLLPLFQWFYDSSLGETIRDSTWLFPVIEALHLLGLALVAGTVLLVDLRLLGVGLRQQPVAQLWATARPLLLGALVLMFVSGTLLFLSESIKAYYSFAFWIKMTSLLLVLVFTFTVRRHVIHNGLTVDRPQLARWTAVVSLTLWFGVAWGGRWIGFS